MSSPNGRRFTLSSVSPEDNHSSPKKPKDQGIDTDIIVDISEDLDKDKAGTTYLLL